MAERSSSIISVIAAVAVAGCTTTGPAPAPPPLTLTLQESRPPSETLRGSLGTVGIVSLLAGPNQEVSKPVRNEDAGKAAARGAGQAIRSVLSAPSQGPVDPRGLILWVVLLPVLVPGGAIVGAGIGAARESAENAANTIPEPTVMEMEALLRRVLAEREPQVELRRLVHALAIARNANLLDVELGGGDSQAMADYTSLSEKGLSTVLEVGVSTVGLVGKGGTDPELTLLLDASVRLIRVPDNHVLWAQDHTVFTSAPHTLSAWKENGGALIQSALNAGLATLARQVDDRVFLEVWPN